MENEQWYQARAHKQLIKEKSLETSIENYIRVEEQFSRRGWAPILNFSQYIYPNLVWELYANIVNIEGYSGALSDSIVRGTRI